MERTNIFNILLYRKKSVVLEDTDIFIGLTPKTLLKITN